MKKILLSFAAALLLVTSVFAGETGKKKDVGIFYFVWLGQHPGQQKGIYDISKLLKEAPEDLWAAPEGTPKSPAGQFHFWGEPLYGYYDSRDPWVVTRHVELLMNAGIDYLMFDTTNAVVYPEAISVVLNVLKKFASQGFDVPKVAFYTNSASGRSVQMIYDNFVKSGEWDGLFYSPKGKPMVVGLTKKNKSSDQGANPDYISDELQEIFDVRESQWPNAPYDENAFPWMSWDNPQRLHNGVISVSVSQHSVETVTFSDTTTCRGRGWDAKTHKEIKEDFRNGRNFRNQWQTVFDNIDRIDNVFVTGWNEWIALKLLNGKKEAIFVDLFNEEFSRDAEMMRGGYGDNFYMLLAENVRRYKGDCGVAAQKGRVFRDFEGDALVRDFKNFDGSARYIDSSARNDIVEITVSESAAAVTFEVRTASDVVPYAQGDLNWMNILVRTDDSSDKAFEYDYVINRYPTVNGVTTVERICADGRKVLSGRATYSVSGDILRVTVPFEALGLEAGDVHFGFKVADNVADPDDIMEYYVSGDSAPIGRLSFDY